MLNVLQPQTHGHAGGSGLARASSVPGEFEWDDRVLFTMSPDQTTIATLVLVFAEQHVDSGGRAAFSTGRLKDLQSPFTSAQSQVHVNRILKSDSALGSNGLHLLRGIAWRTGCH